MNTGASGASVSRLSPCGIFISSTMIVMMIAITPSLKASSLFLPIAVFILVGSGAHAQIGNSKALKQMRRCNSRRRVVLQGSLEVRVVESGSEMRD